MTRLFKREMRMTIVKPKGFFDNETTNAIIIEGLRMTCKVDKSLGKEPNKCSATIYNLSEHTRGQLVKLPLHVTVEAGYDGELSTAFTGDVIWSASRQDNVDRLTEMELGTGHLAYNFASVSRSFAPGVTGLTVLADIAEAMGLRVPQNFSDVPELMRQFAGGLTIQGPAHREMDRLMRPHGFDWSVQDDQLLLLRPGEAKTGTAVIVSQANGMIGVPQQKAPDKSGKQPAKTTVKTLLDPRIAPGGKILVQSQDVNGLFRVDKTTHSIDLWGDFETEVEAVAAKGGVA